MLGLHVTFHVRYNIILEVGIISFRETATRLLEILLLCCVVLIIKHSPMSRDMFHGDR